MNIESNVPTGLDEALVIWSAQNAGRANFAAGRTMPLGHFLAGWFGRAAGIQADPEPPMHPDARSGWRAGWSCCDSTIMIGMREVPHPYTARGDGEHPEDCSLCALSEHHHGARVSWSCPAKGHHDDCDRACKGSICLRMEGQR